MPGRSQRRDYRGVASPVGIVVLGLGAAIALCALGGVLLDLADPTAHDPHGGGTAALGIAAALAVGLGGVLYGWGRRYAAETVSRREATLAVALIWIAAGVFGALPFVIAAKLSPVDALFEAVSGLTTTGATVISDIDGTLSRPLMLWRSLLQWLGGMGIVVLFVAVFPNVGVGGKHMFRGEVPGTTAEGLTPRIAETAFTLWKLYAAITALEVLILMLLGVSAFDAICHAFTTMSTGGFSTMDESISGFHSAAVETAVACFMYIGAVNYGLYYGALRGKSLKVIFKNVEFKAYVAICGLSVLAIAAWILPLHDWDPLQALRFSFFQVGTFVSSTGYVTDDYMAYPAPAIGVIILIMFIGGCAGSTAGGIKVERVVLMLKQTWAQVHRFFRPNAVRVVRIGRKPVHEGVLSDVAAFFIVYMITVGLGVVAISAVEGVPTPTALGATLTCVSNMGPAPFHLAADNFAAYNATTKLIGVLAMLLGRLEFFTLLALIAPAFWRR